jgi:hypothetical protein
VLHVRRLSDDFEVNDDEYSIWNQYATKVSFHSIPL